MPMGFREMMKQPSKIPLIEVPKVRNRIWRTIILRLLPNIIRMGNGRRINAWYLISNPDFRANQRKREGAYIIRFKRGIQKVGEEIEGKNYKV